MKVKGFLKDVGGASRVTKARQEKFDKASATPAHFDPIGEVAKARHPGLLKLTLIEIKASSPNAKTFVFSAPKLPYFQAGQFLTLCLRIGDSLVTRPYSISSAPYQTKGEAPIVEITIKKPRSAGFVSDYLLENAKIGDEFQSEIGLGEFHFETLRDSHNVVGIAGGSGITPFLSLAREIRFGRLDINLTILYGSVNEEDILLKKELEECACEKVKVIHVLSGDNPTWIGEKGFIDADIISRYSKGDTTYFVCGPQAMYGFVHGELRKMGVPKRRIRFEVFGTPRDITQFDDYPKDLAGKSFHLTVCYGISKKVISALSTEPIAVALERAGLKIHTSCRSGTCGFCRLKVLEGSYYVCPKNDGRRSADKDFGYVHACSTYPLSDLKIKANIN